MEQRPPLRLKHFQTSGYQGIKHLKLEFPATASWIFFMGENGYGKTAILQALGGHIRQSIGDADQQKEGKPSDFNSLSWHHYQAGRILFAGYGSSRLDVYSESSTVSTGPLNSLFDNRILLQNIEPQLIRDYLRADKHPEFKARFENVAEVLIRLMDLHSLTVDDGHRDSIVLYQEKDSTGMPLPAQPFRHLPSGMRSIISMFGDLLVRYYQKGEPTTKPEDIDGIVLIDELELHLHPKWQKRLPGLLSEIFPRIQFVVSTHSPMPLLGAPEGSVFVKVGRSADEGTTAVRMTELENMIHEIGPDILLSSPLFGGTNIFPVGHDMVNDRIRTEDTYDDLKFHDRLQQEVERLGQEKTDWKKLFSQLG